MIVVDTSAIMAVLLDEDSAKNIIPILTDCDLCICAGTYAELLIVSAARNLAQEASELFTALGIQVEALDGAGSRAVQHAYVKWGKGRHPASLNFGDCFAYALAKEKDLPLLFIGNDFSKTDLTPALNQK
ncbi:MAG: VapC toxin family PIN domain ribonuclease [Alphaproteobacteria bacterium]|nr:MAG: VapC toxin family PIN domain ribonuclease [Alphaproteobacteria bacterium]